MSGELHQISYTVKQAVQASGLSRATLYRMHQAGRITMKKSGRSTLIKADELARAVDELPDLPRQAA